MYAFYPSTEVLGYCQSSRFAGLYRTFVQKRLVSAQGFELPTKDHEVGRARNKFRRHQIFVNGHEERYIGRLYNGKKTAAA